jgi:hypothetical protein
MSHLPKNTPPRHLYIHVPLPRNVLLEHLPRPKLGLQKIPQLYTLNPILSQTLHERNPNYRGSRCTLTSGQKIKAASLCELPQKRHGNSHRAPAKFM